MGFNTAVYAQGKYVALDDFGATYTSTDGIQWKRSGRNGPSSLRMDYGRGRFVAVAGDYNLAVSTNALEWAGRDLALSLSAVGFGEGLYIVGGMQGPGPPPAIFSSRDTLEWMSSIMATNVWGIHSSVVHGMGRFVAVTDFGIVSASTDGRTWQSQDLNVNGAAGVVPWDVAYGNGEFVTVGAAGQAFSSDDGMEWTPIDLGTTEDLWGVIFWQGSFLIGTASRSIGLEMMPPHVKEIRFRLADSFRLPDGAMLLTVEGPYGQPVVVEGSDDMVNWEEIATDPCDRGEFEVYDEAAAGLPHRFYRAVKWEPPPPPTDPLLNWSRADTVLETGQLLNWKLAYGNAVFVAAGKEDDTSGSAWFSEDGLTWQPSNSTKPHDSLVFGAGRFVSWAGGVPVSTSDGQIWLEHQTVIPETLTLSQAAFGRARFVGLAAEPTDRYEPDRRWFVSSTDGMHWEASGLPDLSLEYWLYAYPVKSGVYAQGWMMFQDASKILRSRDGINWDLAFGVEESFGFDTEELERMGYGGGRFIADGGSSYVTGRLVVDSADGLSWTRRGVFRPDLAAWTFANGAFLGASRSRFSDDAKMLYGSADGVTWTNLVELDTDDDLIDLVFAEGRFYGVNSKGEVWRSDVMPPHVTEPRVIPELTYRLPDGAMLVTVEAPYGHEVVVEGSEDLETWQEVGRDPCDRGEFEIYHETAPPGTDWFYRARQVEP